MNVLINSECRQDTTYHQPDYTTCGSLAWMYSSTVSADRTPHTTDLITLPVGHWHECTLINSECRQDTTYHRPDYTTCGSLAWVYTHQQWVQTGHHIPPTWLHYLWVTGMSVHSSTVSADRTPHTTDLITLPVGHWHECTHQQWVQTGHHIPPTWLHYLWVTGMNVLINSECRQDTTYHRPDYTTCGSLAWVYTHQQWVQTGHHIPPTWLHYLWVTGMSVHSSTVSADRTPHTTNLITLPVGHWHECTLINSECRQDTTYHRPDYTTCRSLAWMYSSTVSADRTPHTTNLITLPVGHWHECTHQQWVQTGHHIPPTWLHYLWVTGMSVHSSTVSADRTPHTTDLITLPVGHWHEYTLINSECRQDTTYHQLDYTTCRSLAWIYTHQQWVHRTPHTTNLITLPVGHWHECTHQQWVQTGHHIPPTWLHYLWVTGMNIHSSTVSADRTPHTTNLITLPVGHWHECTHQQWVQTGHHIPPTWLHYL